MSLVLSAALLLSAVWFPGTFTRATTAPAPLAAAPLLLFHCEDGSQHPLPAVAGGGLAGGAVVCATFRHLRFVYSPPDDAFVVEQPPTQAASTAGLSAGEAERRREYFGPNLIDVPMPSVWRQCADEARARWHLLFVGLVRRDLCRGAHPAPAALLRAPRAAQVLNPFVFFQFFSCVQWGLQLCAPAGTNGSHTHTVWVGYLPSTSRA